MDTEQRRCPFSSPASPILAPAAVTASGADRWREALVTLSHGNSLFKPRRTSNVGYVSFKPVCHRSNTWRT